MCSSLFVSCLFVHGTCMLKVSCAVVMFVHAYLCVSPVVSSRGGWVGLLFCELEEILARDNSLFPCYETTPNKTNGSPLNAKGIRRKLFHGRPPNSNLAKGSKKTGKRCERFHVLSTCHL